MVKHYWQSHWSCSHKQAFSKICNWIMKACCVRLCQIFNSRCQFMDIPVCSWQCADINGCACLVTSPISSEALRQHPDGEFNMSWCTTVAINSRTVTGFSSALNKCMTEARSNNILVYKRCSMECGHINTYMDACNTMQSSIRALQ